MRLDKMISNYISISRTDVKKLIKKGLVQVDGNVVIDNAMEVDEKMEVVVDGAKIDNRKSLVIMLNKPQGVVSATFDKKDKTVIDLVSGTYKRKNLFPAGRLDKDTTGLMIITDDGALAHDILAPRKHVDKSYECTIDEVITMEMIEDFANGVDIGDAICKKAIIEKISDNECIVTISEGRYHQIKRMFEHFGANVVRLNRISMGGLRLDPDLKPGEFRELTKEEMELLKGKQKG